MRDYKVTFWNPGCMPADDDVFGCATLGFAEGDRWAEPTEKASACWRTLRGEAFGGSYDEMLAACRASEARPVAILVFFTADAGNDRFVDTLQDMYKGVPILGGTAARGGDQTVGEVLPKGEHGAVLLITEGSFDTGCKRIHETDVKTVHCEIREDRIIETIDGEPASPFLLKQRAAMGKPANDFESLTFHESCGKNVHCSERGDGTIYAGANLTETDIMLSSIDRADADDAISAYMHRPNALSIGCAGLKSLLTKPFACAENNLGLFLFGEVVPYPDGRSRFANLTLGHLTAK